MKLLISLIFITGLLFSLSANVLGHIDIDLYDSLVQSKYIANKTKQDIALYPESPKLKNVLDVLPVDAYLPLAYTGKSKERFYVKKNGQVLSIRDAHITHGYLVNRQWFVSHYYMVQIFWMSGVIALLSALYLAKKLLFWPFVSMHKKRKHKKEIENYQLTISALQMQNNRKQQNQQDLTNKLKDYERQIIQSNQEISTYKKNQLRTSKSDKLKIKELNNKINKIIQDESYKRNKDKATIHEMRISYEKLDNMYKEVIRDAKVFGVDFDAHNFKNLLTGRKYELFVAQKLVENEQFKILEWTPDKGFDNNIKVESNTNPDLIVQHSSGETLAIECKYRSSYFFKTDKKDFSWSSQWQVQRYQNFEKKRNIPVLIALGAFNSPSAPRFNYLIELNDLVLKSQTYEVKDRDIQLIVLKDKIENKCVKDNDFGLFFNIISNNGFV
jgi:hypothetical protein